MSSNLTASANIQRKSTTWAKNSTIHPTKQRQDGNLSTGPRCSQATARRHPMLAGAPRYVSIDERLFPMGQGTSETRDETNHRVRLRECLGRPDRGCATQSRVSYAESVSARPIPTTEDGRVRECDWIRGEIARQQGIAEMGGAMATSPFMAAAYRAAAQQNIAALNARAANVGCYAAFSPRQSQAMPVPAQPSESRPVRDGAKLSFDQCFARCQELTDRTKDQCFDVCNK